MLDVIRGNVEGDLWTLQTPARRHQLVLASRLEEAFGHADLILLPTLTHLPRGAHDLEHRGWLASLLASADIIGNTALLNVTGHPCVSVPAGLSLTGVLVGAQLVARTGCEDLLLAAVAQLEAVVAAEEPAGGAVLRRSRCR